MSCHMSGPRRATWADSLTQVREYLDGEVRAAGRDEGGEEVPPAEADHQARAEVGDLQVTSLIIPR